MSIELGKKYKDNCTGIEGVATAMTEYQFGCKWVLLEKVGKDENGNPQVLEFWFDEQRLTTKSKAKTGGPGSIPLNRIVPVRR